MNRETICAVVRDLLPSYIDGLTEGATNTFVEQHLAECEACRAAKREMQQVTTPAEQAQAEFLERLRRARIRRRRRGWTIAALLAAALIVCLVPLPRSVDLQVPAILWRSGYPQTDIEWVPVTMKGIYMDYLFFDDYYDGDIMIEGVEITQREDALPRVTMRGEGYLVYADENGMLNSTGFIVGKPGFTEFVIGLYDKDGNTGSWSGDNGLVLTYPARNREEAVAATRRICQEEGIDWLNKSVWEAGISRKEWEASKEK